MRLACAKQTQSASWKNIDVDFPGLLKHLQDNIVKTTETRQEYLSLEKPERARIKNVGGVMAGFLIDGQTRRKMSNLVGADVLAYDADTAGLDLISRLRAPGQAFVAHTKRSHTIAAPRWRVFMPLSRTATPAEWLHCMKVTAQTYGVDNFCGCSYRINQVMYYGSHSKDQPGTAFADNLNGAVIDVDATLRMPYDRALFTVRGEEGAQHENPCDRDDTSGAFCGLYSPQEAMENWLGDIYEPTTDIDRWRYREGHGEAGVIIYQDSLVFSHQSDDPCADGHCHSAFDLIKVHMFDGDFAATCQWIEDKMPEVVSEKAKKAFRKVAMSIPESTAVTDGGDCVDWKSLLDTHKKTKEVLPTPKNCYIICTHDPALSNIALNLMTHRAVVRGTVPWNRDTTPWWVDSDDKLVAVYLKTNYANFRKTDIEEALTLMTSLPNRRFNPLQDKLNSFKWDGVKRAESVLIDRFGAEDTPLNRAMTRKWIAACAQRAFNPGIKFDSMLILYGIGNIGKSTFFDWMSLGFFTDTLYVSDMEDGKKAAEKMERLWIAELGELAGMRKADQARLKSFLSSRSDLYRAAFGRNLTEQPRLTVFGGTSNTKNILTDETGNRRYWIIECNKSQNYLTKADVEQIWAEAKATLMSENLTLSEAEESLMDLARGDYFEMDALHGTVFDWLSKPIRCDHYDILPVSARSVRTYQENETIGTKNRLMVSAQEIWVECLGKKLEDLTKNDKNRFGKVLRVICAQAHRRWRCPGYGWVEGYDLTSESARVALLAEVKKAQANKIGV